MSRAHRSRSTSAGRIVATLAMIVVLAASAATLIALGMLGDATPPQVIVAR